MPLLASLLLLAGAPIADDPLTRPIATDQAAEWLTPQPPLRLHGDSYLVGFGGLNVVVIHTTKGLIVIDAALPQAVPAIEANIRALGFRTADIRYMLSTEPHYDHAGGIPALARDSGATVIAGAAAVPALRSGRNAADDPQSSFETSAPPVRVVRGMRNGATIRLGETVVTARATPGHTAGSTSWTWRSCERGDCRTIVFASSMNPVSADGYRFGAHPAVVGQFRTSFAALRRMPCDILITAHPDQSGGTAKRAALQAGAGANPFIDPAACKTYAARYEAALDARLAKEKAGR